METLANVMRGVNRAEAEMQAMVAQSVAAAAAPLVAPGGRALGEMLDRAVTGGIEQALSGVAQRYAVEALGAERSQRVDVRQGFRSGTRKRRLVTPLGTLELSFVKSRTRTLVPPFLANRGQFMAGVAALGRKLWVRGLSTRNVAAVAEEALGGAVSHETVAGWVQESYEEVLTWLNRPIPSSVRYLVLDALWVSVKRQTARKEAVLVAVGIAADGSREVLDVMSAPTESHAHWATFLARLRGRGLDPKQLRLAITDGNEGLMGAVEAELPGTPRQRCTVHKVRNVVGRAPKALKSIAPREASAIWKAPNKSEARARATAFIEKYRGSHPYLADIVANDFEATLAFFDLDASLWKTMATTNVVERVNRELRRKFDDMGGCKGEQAVTRTAALTAMKLSRDWEGTVVKGFRKPRRTARSAT